MEITRVEIDHGAKETAGLASGKMESHEWWDVCVQLRFTSKRELSHYLETLYFPVGEDV